MFLNEDTLAGGFCEWNADGSSGMNEDRELNISLRASATMREFAKRHQLQTSDLFNPWVEEFIRIYDTFENKVEHPTFAIADFMENAVVDEFRVYARLGPKPIISQPMGDLTSAVIWVDCDLD